MIPVAPWLSNLWLAPSQRSETPASGLYALNHATNLSWFWLFWDRAAKRRRDCFEACRAVTTQSGFCLSAVCKLTAQTCCTSRNDAPAACCPMRYTYIKVACSHLHGFVCALFCSGVWINEAKFISQRAAGVINDGRHNQERNMSAVRTNQSAVAIIMSAVSTLYPAMT